VEQETASRHQPQVPAVPERVVAALYSAGFDSPSDQRLTEVLLSKIASRLNAA